MLRRPLNPGRILLTVDAVGGVWRYAVDAARGLAASGIGSVLVGLGPRPSFAQEREVADLDGVDLDWLDAPLDWMAASADELRRVPALLNAAAERHGADLLHLNLPSQAAGISADLPRIVVSHSCVHTWWRSVHGKAAPREWAWQWHANRDGFDAAGVTLAPSASHARALEAVYGTIEGLRVVPNASRPATDPAAGASAKEPFVLSVGRWWDEGKNGRMLDSAAGLCAWPVVMVGALRGPHGQEFEPVHARAPGPMDGAAVRTMMGWTAVFAAPSLYEPFGLAALEAANAGAALVMADIPGFREIWNGAALFADPRDAQAFSRALDAVAADDVLRRDLASRAASRAAGFTIERQTALLMDAYAAATMAAPRHEVPPRTARVGR